MAILRQQSQNFTAAGGRTSGAWVDSQHAEGCLGVPRLQVHLPPVVSSVMAGPMYQGIALHMSRRPNTGSLPALTGLVQYPDLRPVRVESARRRTPLKASAFAIPSNVDRHSGQQFPCPQIKSRRSRKTPPPLCSTVGSVVDRARAAGISPESDSGKLRVSPAHEPPVQSSSRSRITSVIRRSDRREAPARLTSSIVI